MSMLYDALRNDRDYAMSRSILTLECYQMTRDNRLYQYGYPINSENVHTYFDGGFFHRFLLLQEAKQYYDPLLSDKTQVFLGVFAMEHGVKIEAEDMEIMQHALIRSNLRADKKEMIGEAFAEYGRTGSLALNDQWIVLTSDALGIWRS